MGRADWVFALCLALCLALTGCPSPTQYGGPIPIDHQGLAQRMGLLCRAGSASQGHCMPAQERHAQLADPVDAGGSE